MDIRTMHEHWKPIAGSVVTVVAAVWITITWADDKLRKIERVPALEQAVWELKAANLKAEERNAVLEREITATNKAILAKLDRLLEDDPPGAGKAARTRGGASLGLTPDVPHRFAPAGEPR